MSVVHIVKCENKFLKGNLRSDKKIEQQRWQR